MHDTALLAWVKSEKVFLKIQPGTGDVATYDGLLGVPVLEFKLWPESEWIKSPGGLGVRHMPEMT